MSIGTFQSNYPEVPIVEAHLNLNFEQVEHSKFLLKIVFKNSASLVAQ